MRNTERKRIKEKIYLLAAIVASFTLLGGCGNAAPQNASPAYTEARAATPEEQEFIRELFLEAAKGANRDTSMSGSIDFDLEMSLLGRIHALGFSCQLQSEREGNIEHTKTELTTWTEKERHTETGESYGRKDGEELYTVYTQKEDGGWAQEPRTSFGLFLINDLILTAMPDTCTLTERDEEWVVSGLVNADDITTALEDVVPGATMPTVADADPTNEEVGELLKAKITFYFNKKTGALSAYVIDLREPLLEFSEKLMLEEAAGVTNPVLARILRSFLRVELSACRVSIDEIKQDPAIKVSIPEEAL